MNRGERTPVADGAANQPGKALKPESDASKARQPLLSGFLFKWGDMFLEFFARLRSRTEPAPKFEDSATEAYWICQPLSMSIDPKAFAKVAERFSGRRKISRNAVLLRREGR
jgi:hypothetical protein